MNYIKIIEAQGLPQLELAVNAFLTLQAKEALQDIKVMPNLVAGWIAVLTMQIPQ